MPSVGAASGAAQRIHESHPPYICVYTYTYTRVCMHVYMCIYIYIYTCVYVCIYTYICMHANMYICVCTYIYIYIFMFKIRAPSPSVPPHQPLRATASHCQPSFDQDLGGSKLPTPLVVGDDHAVPDDVRLSSLSSGGVEEREKANRLSSGHRGAFVEYTRSQGSGFLDTPRCWGSRAGMNARGQSMTVAACLTWQSMILQRNELLTVRQHAHTHLQT